MRKAAKYWCKCFFCEVLEVMITKGVMKVVKSIKGNEMPSIPMKY